MIIGYNLVLSSAPSTTPLKHPVYRTLIHIVKLVRNLILLRNNSKNSTYITPNIFLTETQNTISFLESIKIACYYYEN